MGFLGKVGEIIGHLPPRQTILVSATLHSQLQELQDLSLTRPVIVGGLQDEEFSVSATPRQHFVVVPAKWRLTALAGLLRRCARDIANLKCIVFINCCLSVDFHDAFFNFFKYMTPAERRARRSEPRREVVSHEPTIRDVHKSVDNDEIGGFSPFLKCQLFRIHGNVEQIDRVKTISQFTGAQSAVLFCTDVAARGLDIPDVNAIVQYDPPVDSEDYVHRVGRTARIGRDGIAYLFLQDFESGFARLLRERSIQVQEFPYRVLMRLAVDAMGGDDDELCFAAMRKETFTTANENDLTNLAAKAWASAIKAYTNHRKETRDIFNKTKLHLGHTAAAFALEKTPAELKEMLAEERDLIKRSRRGPTIRGRKGSR
jgi:ATP-dependent RNA helicase DDX31/DBP7